MSKWTKAKTNLVIDAAIGLSFLGLAISGLVLWLVLPSGGYQGGRGALNYARTFIFSRDAWKLLHDWLSVSMIAGVLLHVALHWNWIVCMVRNMWREASAQRQATLATAALRKECEI